MGCQLPHTCQMAHIFERVGECPMGWCRKLGMPAAAEDRYTCHSWPCPQWLE